MRPAASRTSGRSADRSADELALGLIVSACSNKRLRVTRTSERADLAPSPRTTPSHPPRTAFRGWRRSRTQVRRAQATLGTLQGIVPLLRRPTVFIALRNRLDERSLRRLLRRQDSAAEV